MELDETQQRIWDVAFARQDLRDDAGHARTVTEFAIKLGKMLGADLYIVIPAAILHDTGYFGIDLDTLRLMMAKKLSDSQVEKIKEEHMIKGAAFVAELLPKLGFSQESVAVVSHIVRNHDYKTEPTSVEERVVRDADKLWRYSHKGFFLDIRRQSKIPIEHYEKLKKNFAKDNYFWTHEAVVVAKEELEKRRTEL